MFKQKAKEFLLKIAWHLKHILFYL